ncbi:MAG: ATP-binding protein [Candidatus Omnitrophota bacterium]
MKRKISLKVKIIFVVCSIALAISSISIILGYLWGLDLLRSMAGENHVRMAKLMASSIGQMIDREIKTLQAIMTDIDYIEAVEEANTRYHNISSEEIQTYMADMDNQWIHGSEGNFVIKEYLEKRISQKLKVLREEDEDIAEIFITDQMGGLVASSGKTTDFYQADEKWWKEAFHEAKGNIYVEKIEFDEPAGMLSIAFAIPIRNSEGRTIGVCKCVIDINNFFRFLKDFAVGQTGHAVLANKEGDILYHQGIKPFSMKILKPQDFQKLLQNKQQWSIMQETHIHKKKIIISFAKVNQPFLLERGIVWIVAIDQDYKEVFFPLRIFAAQRIVLLFFLLIILLPIGFFIGEKFIRPIRTLQVATKRIAQGDMDHVIEIKTGDEIEEFADSFNRMTKKLKETATSVLTLNQEIAIRNEMERNLKKSNEDLAKNGKALKNILFDLKKTHDDLQNAQQQLLQSEKMAAVGQLSAGIAHEVKNPLSIILLSIESLESKIDHLSEQNKMYIKMIKDACERANKVVVDLLDFSRYSEQEFGYVKILQVLKDTVSLVEHSARIQNVMIQQEYSGETDMIIEGDHILLQQAFLNLFTNALDAIENTGTITVKTHLLQDSEEIDNIRIEVSDTGSGMPPEVTAKIFEPFFTTKEQGKGTGLGLSMAFMIIGRHHGNIHVESEVGKGTKFIITLPICSEDEKGG